MLSPLRLQVGIHLLVLGNHQVCHCTLNGRAVYLSVKSLYPIYTFDIHLHIHIQGIIRKTIKLGPILLKDVGHVAGICCSTAKAIDHASALLGDEETMMLNKNSSLHPPKLT